jgi:hypothetical protein
MIMRKYFQIKIIWKIDSYSGAVWELHERDSAIDIIRRDLDLIDTVCWKNI